MERLIELMESRIRRNVYVRFGGEHLKTYHSNMERRWVLSLRHVFKARLEEYLDISTEGTGIPVSITIDDPSFDRDLYAVKPGFTCSIRFTADVGPLVQDSWTIIPLSAVFGESDGNNMYVWVVEDNKVHKRKIVVNAPTGEAQVLVSEGLKPGEQIVIAGVYQLVEGESIKSIDK